MTDSNKHIKFWQSRGFMGKPWYAKALQILKENEIATETSVLV